MGKDVYLFTMCHFQILISFKFQVVRPRVVQYALLSIVLFSVIFGTEVALKIK